MPGMGKDVIVFPPVGVGMGAGSGAVVEVTTGAGGTAGAAGAAGAAGFSFKKAQSVEISAKCSAVGLVQRPYPGTPDDTPSS